MSLVLRKQTEFNNRLCHLTQALNIAEMSSPQMRAHNKGDVDEPVKQQVDMNSTGALTFAVPPKNSVSVDSMERRLGLHSGSLRIPIMNIDDNCDSERDQNEIL
jgi:hypothetical protein